MNEKMHISDEFDPSNEHTLVLGDCKKLLELIPDEFVDLTVTSPPYCIGKEYESTIDVNDFTREHLLILPEIARITKEGGSICWQIGYHKTAREIVPLDYLIYDICKTIPSLKLRNRIVWTFGHGLHETQRFTGRHEMILWFTKGDTYNFDLDAIRVPQKYPGKKSYRGPKKGSYSGNPLGKNPSDVWDIPNVKANHREKTIHPCQFPVALAYRLINALTRPGDLVFDPFSGVGTTGAAATLLTRRFLGAELNAGYWDVARQRMLDAASGTLPVRDPDQPVFDPSEAGSVAAKPSHFSWTPEEVGAYK